MKATKFTVEKRGGRWCYIDTEGKVLKSLLVNQAYPFSEGMAKIKVYNCMGYIDSKFRIIVEPKYGIMSNRFCEGLALVTTPGDFTEAKFGFINKKGLEVIPLQYDLACSFHEGLATVSLNNKWGAINKKGELVIEFSYDSLSDCHQGYLIFLKGGCSGILTRNNREIAISKETDDIEWLEDKIHLYGETIFLNKAENKDWLLVDSNDDVLFRWTK